jgi:hypothetical protein
MERIVAVFQGPPQAFTAAFDAMFRVLSVGLVALAAGLAIYLFRLIGRLRSEEVRKLFRAGANE